jgi:hypothetical protein
MKKAFLYLGIFILVFTVGSCKKPCYTCYAQVYSAYQIDTFNYYGIIKYDTTGGYPDTLWKFRTCEANSKYSYGDVTISPTTQIDTFINCHQNNY